MNPFILFNVSLILSQHLKDQIVLIALPISTALNSEVCLF